MKSHLFAGLLGGIVVAVLLAGSSALAAQVGDPLKLGLLNQVAATTRLKNTANGPALNLVSQAGQPPLAVSNTVKITKLNADRLDGLDSASFLGVNGVAVNSQTLDGMDSSDFLQAYVTVTEIPFTQNVNGVNATINCFGDDTAVAGAASGLDLETELISIAPFATAAPQAITYRFDTTGVTDPSDLITLHTLCLGDGS
ncbi:MAG: hypothetical protein WEB00_13380 [Dehalococcoidia bacterium]